jgi:hypothetical protein
MTKAIAVLVGLAFMLATASAFAGTGKFKVILKDDKGVTINAKVTAKRGSTVKTCDTSAGVCYLSSVDEGSWTLSAKTSNGAATGGPKTVTAKSGQTVTVTIILTKKTTSRR